MGYSVFKFGTLTLDGEIQPVPQCPMIDGDIPLYDGKATISLAASAPKDGITWIKPNGSNLLVSDCVLLTKVSWEDLDKNGFVEGKTVLLGGKRFCCRLLQVGEKEGFPNEWDKILDETNTDKGFWHWKDMFFWGADISVYRASTRAVRGYLSARNWLNRNATNRSAGVGFRPALEPLPFDSPTPNINLEGADFQLTSLPGGNDFCPILQPIQTNVFKDIQIRGTVRMYTFIENGRPVHMDGQIEDVTKLTLTDRYFGDEYLVSWTLSNGIAVATKSMLKQDKS